MRRRVVGMAALAAAAGGVLLSGDLASAAQAESPGGREGAPVTVTPERRPARLGASPAAATSPGHVPGQPYDRATTTDRLGRTIVFYLSEARGPQAPAPLVVYIQGSGCGSHFAKIGERIVPRGGHITVQESAAGRARVLIVEKPGVAFLDDPVEPSEQSGGMEFRREHTLGRWVEAVEAAIRAAHGLAGVDPSKTLVIGHSEGGLAACRVARDLPGVVTHVASFAGGGPTQLFDLIALARAGSLFRHVSEDPEARVRFLLDQWSAVRADPESTEKLFLGFAHRRWSTFLASSPIEELSTVRAKVYLAQGLEDRAVDPASSDALYAHLAAEGRSVVYDRVTGADHSFQRKAAAGSDGWREAIDRVLAWFIGAS